MQAAAPETVLSVEEEEAVSRWNDPSSNEGAAPGENGGGNGTVFVIPDSARHADEQGRWEYLKGGAPDCASLGSVSELQDEGSSSEDTLSRDLERVSLGSLGKWTWDVHSIVLDLSTANFIDTVAIKTLRSVSSSLSCLND